MEKGVYGFKSEALLSFHPLLSRVHTCAGTHYCQVFWCVTLPGPRLLVLDIIINMSHKLGVLSHVLCATSYTPCNSLLVSRAPKTQISARRRGTLSSATCSNNQSPYYYPASEVGGVGLCWSLWCCGVYSAGITSMRPAIARHPYTMCHNSY